MRAPRRPSRVTCVCPDSPGSSLLYLCSPLKAPSSPLLQRPLSSGPYAAGHVRVSQVPNLWVPQPPKPFSVPELRTHGVLSREPCRSYPLFRQTRYLVSSDGLSPTAPNPSGGYCLDSLSGPRGPKVVLHQGLKAQGVRTYPPRGRGGRGGTRGTPLRHSRAT